MWPWSPRRWKYSARWALPMCRIGEGPGHRRDTYAMAELTRYRSEIPHFDDVFVDLNRDDVSPIQEFRRPRRDLFPEHASCAADLIVSLAKMKTHHWAGATLSMKNFFGTGAGLHLRLAQE